jgi:hypothetical protein
MAQYSNLKGTDADASYLFILTMPVNVYSDSELAADQ